VISRPIALATAREKLSSTPVVIVALCYVLVCAVRGGSEGGAEVFDTFSFFFLMLLTLVLGTGLLSDELESGHAQLVLLRPVTRSAWFGGRLAGASLALAACVSVGWAAAAITGALRGYGFTVERLVYLPLGTLWGVAWLSVLAVLGVVLPRWTNAGALVLAFAGWFFAVTAIPALLGRPELAATIQAASPYLKPQDPLLFARDPRQGLGPVLYDLIWIFGCFWIGSILTNRLELARRRA
jgi:hypothetical protein